MLSVVTIFLPPKENASPGKTGGCTLKLLGRKIFTQRVVVRPTSSATVPLTGNLPFCSYR